MGFETAFFAAFPCESGRKDLGAPMPGFADSERELWVELYRIPHVFYPTVANSRRFVQPRGHGFTAAAEQDSCPRPDGPFFIEHCVLGSGTPGIAALTYSSASLNQVRNPVFPLNFRPAVFSDFQFVPGICRWPDDGYGLYPGNLDPTSSPMPGCLEQYCPVTTVDVSVPSKK